MGIDHLVGVVETGKRADLVLLDDNPLIDPNAYQRPALVIHDGQVVFDLEGGVRVTVHP